MRLKPPSMTCGFAGLFLYQLFFGALIYASAGLSPVFAEDPEIETEWQYVIPRGVEERVEGLFLPYKTGSAVGTTTFEKITIEKDRIKAGLIDANGMLVWALIRHPGLAAQGEQVFASVALSFPTEQGAAVDNETAALLAEAIRKNDDGNFPWKKVFSKSAVFNAENGDAVAGWSTGGTLEIWKIYFAWILTFLLIVVLLYQHREALRAWQHANRELSLVLVVLLACSFILRIWIAPEALYKEAYHFRYLWVIGHPLGEAVTMSSHYPAGLHFLYQLGHAFTGVHPVNVLFLGNLAFGCVLPIFAALVGFRLHRNSLAPCAYAAVAVFLPQLVKYAHSEAITGPQAAMLMVALWSLSFATRSWVDSILAGLVFGLLATIRPEGFVAFPGLILWLLYFANASKPDPDGSVPVWQRFRWALIPILLAAFISFESVARVLEAQFSSQGIEREGMGVLNLTPDASIWTMAVAAMGRALNPEWSVFLSYRFTPLPFILFGVGGFLWFLKQRPLMAFSLFVTFMGYAGIYAFFVSTLKNEGEMRYHLSMAPVWIVWSGAAMQAIADRFSKRWNARVALGFVVLVSFVSFSGHADLVTRCDHPFQQEYEVLRDQVLDRNLIDIEHTMVFVPPKNDSIIDIRPTSIAPMLSDIGMTASVQAWHPSKISEAIEHLDDIPVYFYRGLYSHYLSGPSVDPDKWWGGRMNELGLTEDAARSPRLKKVFSTERPFMPNHQVLDQGFEEGNLTIALYQLIK